MFQLIVELLVVLSIFFVLHFLLHFIWDRFFDKANRCWQAYDKGDYETVIRIAKPRAEKGQVDFQWFLGLIYDSEHYPFRDSKKAIEWLLLAANQQHEFAQCLLGEIYDEGREDIEPSYGNAIKWYEVASKSGLLTKNGLDIAQCALGVKKLNVGGDPMDVDGAIRAFKLSAEQGNLQSLIILGALYFDGDYCNQDFQKSITYLKLAVEKGAQDGVSESILGQIYENGMGVEANQREAKKWYNRAAENGDADAMNNLGVLYYSGNGVEKDEEEAVRLFKMASDSGSQEAESNLEIVKNNSVPKKYQSALDTQREKAVAKVRTETFSTNKIITFPSRK